MDIGESSSIRNRVESDDRAPCWRGRGHTTLSVAALYTTEPLRMLIERELRTQFNPPCGWR